MSDVERMKGGTRMKNPIWKHVTPVPPEMNGHGYLWECRKCGMTVPCHTEPKFPCPRCKQQRKEQEAET